MSKIKTHHYFWIASLFFVIQWIYWLKSDEAILEINLHDTYFVIHNSVAVEILSLLFFLIGVVYWIFYIKKIALNKLLTNIHLIVTLFSIILYYIIYYSYCDNLDKMVILVSFLILIVFSLQLIFIINIIISLIKKRKINN